MSDSLGPAPLRPRPTAQRPLLGLTVLVVEDSRYASEAIRLMSLRSGARIRRADCLRSARRHLSAYRPAVAIVDMGLPDGSGEELIRELAEGGDSAAVLVATSGDTSLRETALAAGAQAFLPKPVESLAAFQETVLGLLPPEAQPRGPRLVKDEFVRPDPLAFHDDMAHVSDLMARDLSEPEVLDYIAQFLETVSTSARDDKLAGAARALSKACQAGQPSVPQLGVLREMVDQRLQHRASI